MISYQSTDSYFHEKPNNVPRKCMLEPELFVADGAQRNKELVFADSVSFPLLPCMVTKEKENACVYFLLFVCFVFHSVILTACVSF